MEAQEQIAVPQPAFESTLHESEDTPKPRVHWTQTAKGKLRMAEILNNRQADGGESLTPKGYMSATKIRFTLHKMSKGLSKHALTRLGYCKDCHTFYKDLYHHRVINPTHVVIQAVDSEKEPKPKSYKPKNAKRILSVLGSTVSDSQTPTPEAQDQIFLAGYTFHAWLLNHSKISGIPLPKLAALVTSIAAREL